MTSPTHQHRVNADAFTITRIVVSPMVAKSNATETISVKVVSADGSAPSTPVTVNWVADVGLHGKLAADSSLTNTAGIAEVTFTSDNEGFFPIKASIEGGNSYKVTAARYQNDEVKAPYVLNSLDGEIDEYDLKSDITVRIPPYPSSKVGDTVVFYWGEIHHTSIEITAANLATNISINITQTFPPACLIDGKYQLFYEHIDEANNPEVSKPMEVTVTGGKLPSTLPEPTFPEATTGLINNRKAESEGGTPVEIAYLKMAADDILHLVWEGYNDSNFNIPEAHYEVEYPVTAADVTAKKVTLVVPTDNITAIGEGTAQAYYELTPASGGDKETSAVAEVNVDTQG